MDAVVSWYVILVWDFENFVCTLEIENVSMQSVLFGYGQVIKDSYANAVDLLGTKKK